jgi:hypothetical protein
MKYLYSLKLNFKYEEFDDDIIKYSSVQGFVNVTHFLLDHGYKLSNNVIKSITDPDILRYILKDLLKRNVKKSEFPNVQQIKNKLFMSKLKKEIIQEYGLFFQLNIPIELCFICCEYF